MQQKVVFYSNILSEYALDNKIELNRSAVTKLTQYMIDILEENEKVNLTSIKDCESFIEKHLIDSLLILRFLPEEEFNLVDIGTGGGFPGVPIAIAREEAKVVLIDSTAKKLKSVESAIQKEDIRNITCIHARAETAGRLPAYRDHFDYAVSRAVSNLRILSELCLPFVRVGGSFYAYKSKNYESELDEAKEIIEKLGAKIEKVNEVKLKPSGSERVLIEIKKLKNTPEKYPRDFAKIKNDS